MTIRANENILKPHSSPDFENVSTAMQELVELPNEPDFTKPKFSTISFACKANCTVIVNEKYELKINKDYGLELDENFGYIYSFIVKESGIPFYFLSSY